jgi:endonuclease I
MPGNSYLKGKKLKRLIIIALWLCSITGSSAVIAEPDPAYYDTADDTSSQSLRDSLHAIIDDHSRYPYTSSATDTWDVLEIADEDQDNPDNVITIYQNGSYQKRTGGNDFYNREHTWPKSYGFPDNGAALNYPYTDMHHLFLSDSDYNFNRSNKPYDNCDSNCIENATETNNDRGGIGGSYPGDSNWTDGDYTQGRWEPWEARKGDVARAMMYMDVRYAGGTHGITGDNEPDLILTDDRNLMDQSNTGDNESIGYMGLLSVLLQWHQADPVDLIEMQHHETVAAFQGNRNPFIDHPEWAACVFEANCPSFQINAGLNDAWYNPATDGQGFFFTAFAELGVASIAWFTYDTELPTEDAQANLGDAGHRWITAIGPVVDNQVIMNIDIASGGIFDTKTDVTHTTPAGSDGTITVTFENCKAGLVEYDIASINRQGVVPIQRVAEDNVALCEALSSK